MPEDPGLDNLKQRYCSASSELTARVKKLTEAAGSLELDAFLKLWNSCDEVRRLCVELHQQIDGKRDVLSRKLTNREEEVLRLVACGLSNKEIGVALDVSVKTIEFHKGRIYEKLSLGGTADLVRYAIRIGLITP